MQSLPHPEHMRPVSGLALSLPAWVSCLSVFFVGLYLQQMRQTDSNLLESVDQNIQILLFTIPGLLLAFAAFFAMMPHRMVRYAAQALMAVASLWLAGCCVWSGMNLPSSNELFLRLISAQVGAFMLAVFSFLWWLRAGILGRL